MPLACRMGTIMFFSKLRVCNPNIAKRCPYSVNTDKPEFIWWVMGGCGTGKSGHKKMAHVRAPFLWGYCRDGWLLQDVEAFADGDEGGDCLVELLAGVGR